ncbi:TetR/AcrR family transcriptional regulator [Streptacidiphilus carbonis]|jgi:AcrR family transcriptional regulator|uniref:TetR/AcrR family transcriptional regulator n=1 Tax=Streptacidiphilus carbonis TaxID=105422 RepID=UPI0005AB6EEF|nr:TetR/AcrR family transcriptional regulator [Streptacidiphilus carbonis]
MTAPPPPPPAPPGRPMRADARRNYERLVQVATEAFLEHGADASLDDIAKRAGVGPGTLYRHFPVRQDLIDAVLQRWMASVLTEAEPLRVAADPVEALGMWLRRLVAHVQVFRGLSSALIPPEDKFKESSPAWVLHRTSEELLARAQESGEIRSDIDIKELMTLVSGVTWACDRGKEIDADRLIDLIMDGLRVRDRPDRPPVAGA